MQPKLTPNIANTQTTGQFGVTLDIVNAFLTVVFCGSYIANTYLKQNKLENWMWYLELCVAFCIALDFAIRRIYVNIGTHACVFVLFVLIFDT